jgi:hypothetical protein
MASLYIRAGAWLAISAMSKLDRNNLFPHLLKGAGGSVLLVRCYSTILGPYVRCQHPLPADSFSALAMPLIRSVCGLCWLSAKEKQPLPPRVSGLKASELRGWPET